MCIARDFDNVNWNIAQNYCDGFYAGAQLCTHQQLRRACKHSGFAVSGTAWLGDRIADDRSITVNGTDCDNFDGDVAVTNTQAGYYCCLEFAKY